MKTKIFCILTFLSVALFLLIFTPQISYADNYTVKPYILIPKDWKDRVTQGEIDQYKNGIINNLSSVQQFYSSVLGSTFGFDQSVDVVYSGKDLQGHEGGDIGVLYDTLNLSGFLNSPIIRVEDGRDNAVWIVGSQVVGGTYAQGGFRNEKKAGIVMMPYEDLLAASGLGTGDQQQLSKAVLAHELGHTFGAIWNDYDNGHPCTEVSLDKCKKVPNKVPPAIEWTSVMGYGMPTQLFPNLLFNNTTVNPEKKVICQSPFIQCPSIPEPKDSNPTSDKVTYDGLSTNTIIAGQSFEIRGSGFSQLSYFRLEKMPERKEVVSTDDKLKILDKKTDGKVVLQTPEDLASPNSESEWEIAIAGQKYTFTKLSDRLTVKGKQSSDIVFEGNIKVTCGQEKQPMPNFSVYLLSESNNSKVLTTAMTDDQGSASLVYTITNAVGSTEYHVAPSSFKKGERMISAVTDDGSYIAKITVPEPPADFSASTNFNFPECPEVTPTGSPTPALSETPTGTQVISPFATPTTAASGMEGGDSLVTNNLEIPPADTGQGAVAPEIDESSQVKISNYWDFRENNDIGDIGSPTITIDNPDGHKIDWKLQTLDTEVNKRVYFREIKGDKYTDYVFLLGNDGTAQEAGVYLTAAILKKPVKMVIDSNQEVDLRIESAIQAVSLRLPGEEGKYRDFNIPYEIDYSDGSREYSAITFRYQPNVHTPTPEEPTPTLAADKTITGWVCGADDNIAEGRSLIWENYSDGTRKLNKVCEAGELCQPTQVSPPGYPDGTPDAECVSAGGISTPTPIAPTPTPYILGWQCGVDESNNSVIWEKYSNGYQRIEQTCSPGWCEAINPPSGYSYDAQCVSATPTLPPNPTPTPYIIGWQCGVDESNNSVIWEKYSNNYQRIEQVCPAGSWCEAIDPPSGYSYDAQCVFAPTATPEPPAATPTPRPYSTGSCYIGGDTDNNCVYSDESGCYIGHTDDFAGCNWIDGSICFNPGTVDTGGTCTYSCGPVPCP